jgi:hypothetical protein
MSQTNSHPNHLAIDWVLGFQWSLRLSNLTFLETPRKPFSVLFYPIFYGKFTNFLELLVGLL